MKKECSTASRQLLVAILFCTLLCYPSGAYAGWFVPENRIAWQAWHNGDSAASLKHWDQSSKGMYGRASVLMSKGRMREAERDLRLALSDAGGLEPAYIASIWYNLGNCLYAEGALKRAREAWHQAMHYNPEHAKAAHNLAVLEHLLIRKREQTKNAFSAPLLMQKRKGKQQKHGDNSQAKNSLPASGDKAGTHKGEDGGGGGKVKTMSEAEREVNGVRDSMDVFLRHRLAEKSARTASSRRGPPW